MKNFEKKNFSIFLKKKFFLVFWNFWQFNDSNYFKNGLKLNILYNLYTLNCPKHKKSEKIFFQKKLKKNFFLYFLKFFISDWIYTPKIMTKNLSHVILSWSYRKKVCDMHILCILRHNFQKNCKKNFFLYFQNFSFLIGFLHPKSWQTICLMSWLHDYIRKKYVTCIPFAHQGLQKAQSVVRYPVYLIIRGIR